MQAAVRFVQDVFDRDADGYLSRHEIDDFFRAFDTQRARRHLCAGRHKPSGDGLLCWEEFYEAARTLGARRGAAGRRCETAEVTAAADSSRAAKRHEKKAEKERRRRGARRRRAAASAAAPPTACLRRRRAAPLPPPQPRRRRRGERRRRRRRWRRRRRAGGCRDRGSANRGPDQARHAGPRRQAPAVLAAPADAPRGCMIESLS